MKMRVLWKYVENDCLQLSEELRQQSNVNEE